MVISASTGTVCPQPNDDDAGRFLILRPRLRRVAKSRPPRPPPVNEPPRRPWFGFGRLPGLGRPGAAETWSRVYPQSAMQFGVTVLPDPPWQRLVELMQLAEQNGFE